jgi:hypothetical protein
MPQNSADSQNHWAAAILTDMHFWVPLIVLVAGLLLLGSIR